MRAERRRKIAGRAAFALVALAVSLISLPGQAGEPPQFAFPVDCAPGKDCWLYQYVDVDPGPTARDYMCGHRSYEGHKGTDIAVADLGAMQRGVTVIAAAAGTVRNIRDGVMDRLATEWDRGPLEGRECGNGVAIQHGDGWETMYCHMRNGSIRVRPDEQVVQGQPLGMIGLSGNTQFPHLHFGVRHGNTVIDPFLGASPPEGCGSPGRSLWAAASREAVRYSPVDIYQVGAAVAQPEPEAAYAGDLDDGSFPSSAPALVAWTTIAAVRAGDRLNLRLLGPNGDVVAENAAVLSKNQIRYFAFAGRRRTGPAWPNGEYRVEVRLVREAGSEPVARTASKVITVR